MLLDSGAACKTIRFGERIYLGDPVNIAKIFSDIGVDEIIYLDITKGRHWAGPDMNLIRRIARQCAMPLTYGGGISTVDQARDVLSLGVEKVSIQRGFFENPDLIGQLADVSGSKAFCCRWISAAVTSAMYYIFAIRSGGPWCPLTQCPTPSSLPTPAK